MSLVTSKKKKKNVLEKSGSKSLQEPRSVSNVSGLVVTAIMTKSGVEHMTPGLASFLPTFFLFWTNIFLVRVLTTIFPYHFQTKKSANILYSHLLPRPEIMQDTDMEVEDTIQYDDKNIFPNSTMQSA